MLHTASRGCSRSWLRRLTALIAVSALAFVALPNVAVAANPMEYLDVSFGGTFAEDTYTTGGDEVARGSVTSTAAYRPSLTAAASPSLAAPTA